MTLIDGQYGRKHGGEKTRMLMKWKLTEFLDLQEEQAEKFFPRFNSFHKDHKKIQSEIGELYDQINKMVKYHFSRPYFVSYGVSLGVLGVV